MANKLGTALIMKTAEGFEVSFYNHGNVVRVIVVDEGRALDVTKEMIAECAGLLRAERDGYISRSEYEELTERVHQVLRGTRNRADGTRADHPRHR